MRFTEFKGNFPTTRPYSKVRGELEEFISMDVKCVKVTWTENEYASRYSCYNALHKAARRNYPDKVQVKTYNGGIYLIRKDI